MSSFYHLLSDMVNDGNETIINPAGKTNKSDFFYTWLILTLKIFDKTWSQTKRLKTM